MQKSNINTFDCKKHIRDQIKQARIEANDSQEDLALALGKSRVTISDLERGRVEINAQDLLGIAIYYSKPIGYFFPRELIIDKEELSPLEQELLLLFYKLPDTQKLMAVEYMREQVVLITKVLQKINSDTQKQLNLTI